MTTTTRKSAHIKKTRVEAVPAAPTAESALTYWLSGLTAAVTLIAASAGFFITDLFQRDNTALGGCARGTALVMLVIALPALIISMVLTSRGSQRARLVWLGMLTYIFYNSFYFTFGTTFHRFFLPFLAMLSLSGWALLVQLSQTRAEEVKAAFGPKTPVRFIALTLLFPVLIFLITDLRESLVATFTNTLPPSIIDTQLPVSTFAVVDLAFLVPVYVTAAVWLLQRRAWGFTLAGMMLSFYALELFGIGVDQYYGSLADPTSPLANASVMPAFFVMAAAAVMIIAAFFRRRTK